MFLNYTQPSLTHNQKQQLDKPRTIPKWIKESFQFDGNEKILPQDQDFIARVLVDVLKYPDKKLSELHRLSHRLGKHDLKSSKKGKIQVNQKGNNPHQYSKQNIFTEGSINDCEPFQHNHQSEICDCCGFVKQSEQISVWESFEQFPIVGLSTFLYFRTIINLLIMVGLLFLIFGGFSCYVNYYIFVSSKGLGVVEGLQEILGNYNTILSYKSIQADYLNHEDTIGLLTKVSVGLIIVTTIVWSILVYVFKHQEVQNSEMIDDQSVTASDFSIMIQDAPIDLFKDLNYVSNQFDQYFKTILPLLEKQYFQTYLNKNNHISSSSSQELQKLKVVKINIGMPFYLNQNNLQTDEEYDQLLDTLDEHKQKIVQWVDEFFSQHKLTVKAQTRQKRFQGYKEIQQKIIRKKQNFLKNLELQHKTINNQGQMKTTVFITFATALCAKIIYELNETTFFSNFCLFSCCKNNKQIKIRAKNNKLVDLKIERAPEPEDIVWQNIGFPFWKIALRRLLTYLITGGILAGSFFLITYLQSVQISSGSSVISMVISGSISILNVAIGLVIYFLTVFEKDITKTNYQASLALKTVFARLINSIVIPVIVKKNNIYGKSGLVEDVFWLAITTSFLDPILKIFDFYYFFTRLKYWYKSKPYNRIEMSQMELNKMAQKLEFEVGSQYIYVTNLFLITCFFSPLQPIIPIFSGFGLIFMYWVQKYSLLNRMRRPIPGSDMINTALGQVITLGPIMFGTGALVFTSLLSENGERGLNFILHLAAIGTGVLFYLLPFKTIYKWIYSEDEKFVNLNYFESRILLPSEYDRINPATAKQGMKDFIDYMGQVNQLCAHDHQNHHNQTSNNKLLQNLTKFVQKQNSKNKNMNMNNSTFMKGSILSNAPLNNKISKKKYRNDGYLQNSNNLLNDKMQQEAKIIQKMNLKQRRQYLRQRKKNSLDQSSNQNYDKRPYVNEFDQFGNPINFDDQNKPNYQNSLLNFNKNHILKNSQFQDLQYNILQNWPTKQGRKIEIPKRSQQMQNNDYWKPYVKQDGSRNASEQKQSVRRTNKFNLMKMKNPQMRDRQVKKEGANTFSFSQLKSQQNQYPFNVQLEKQNEKARSKLESEDSNVIQINPADESVHQNADKIENQKSANPKERNSVPDINQSNRQDFKKRMSIPNEKSPKVKSKLFTPSTMKRTESENDDQFDFY